jgi:transcriptional regulator with XRE-family HTH domain
VASATASIGKTLPVVFQTARMNRGLNQREMGRIMNLSEKTVSAIETGRRNLPQDLTPKAAKVLDDPELYCALQVTVTGGVATPWLDGEKVDLHRSSVRDKAIEECSEAIKALAEAKAMVNCKSAEDLGEKGYEQIQEVLHQAVEAETALQILIGVVCKTYDISIAQVYKDHHAELKAKGYIKG